MGNYEERIEAQKIINLLINTNKFTNHVASRILSKAYNMLLKERKNN